MKNSFYKASLHDFHECDYFVMNLSETEDLGFDIDRELTTTFLSSYYGRCYFMAYIRRYSLMANNPKFKYINIF